MFKNLLIIFVYSFSLCRLVSLEPTDYIIFAFSKLLCHFPVLIIFIDETRMHIIQFHILLMFSLNFLVILLTNQLHFFNSLNMPFFLLPIELSHSLAYRLFCLHKYMLTCSFTLLSCVKLTKVCLFLCILCMSSLFIRSKNELFGKLGGTGSSWWILFFN